MARHTTHKAVRAQQASRSAFKHLSHRQPAYYGHVEDDALYKFYTAAALTAIHQLPAKIRQVYDLSTYYDLNYAQIAVAMKVSERSVKRYSKEAHSLVMRHLQEHSEWSDNYILIIIMLFMGADHYL